MTCLIGVSLDHERNALSLFPAASTSLSVHSALSQLEKSLTLIQGIASQNFIRTYILPGDSIENRPCEVSLEKALCYVERLAQERCPHLDQARAALLREQCIASIGGVFERASTSAALQPFIAPKRVSVIVSQSLKRSFASTDDSGEGSSGVKIVRRKEDPIAGPSREAETVLRVVPDSNILDSRCCVSFMIHLDSNTFSIIPKKALRSRNSVKYLLRQIPFLLKARAHIADVEIPEIMDITTNESNSELARCMIIYALVCRNMHYIKADNMLSKIQISNLSPLVKETLSIINQRYCNLRGIPVDADNHADELQAFVVVEGVPPPLPILLDYRYGFRLFSLSVEPTASTVRCTVTEEVSLFLGEIKSVKIRGSISNFIRKIEELLHTVRVFKKEVLFVCGEKEAVLLSDLMNYFNTPCSEEMMQSFLRRLLQRNRDALNKHKERKLKSCHTSVMDEAITNLTLFQQTVLTFPSPPATPGCF